MFAVCSMKGRIVPHAALDTPFVYYVRGATHVDIRCVSPQRCGRATTMLTADLVALLPHARTLRDFQARMACRRCGCRGWSAITPARRD
jgi:hypothetical protein